MKMRLLTLALAFLPGVAVAQQLDLPRPSPLGKVSQVVGLTEIAVEYSSPAVRGRKVFGEVVPYDKLWRTGANTATKISFSKDVQVAGKPVLKGTYAIFTIPGKNEWTVILNKNPDQGGTDQYKQELDALRFTAKPKAIPHREHLTFTFGDFNENGASLDLEWDKLRVTIPIKVDTDKQAAAAIAGLDDAPWRLFNQAARYELDIKHDYDKGLELVDKSLKLKEDWLNNWTKAQLLAAKGKYKDAYPYAEKANDLGAKTQNFFFAEEVKKALNDWKKKS